MSASASASAHASLPEMSISLSSLATCPAFVSTAMDLISLSRSARLGGGVLAGDTRGDLDAARVELLGDLLVVLAAEAEAVRADHVALVVDLARHPAAVAVLVVPPHVPLARVVLEGGLAHHRDAIR